jgi:hypothetical protein
MKHETQLRLHVSNHPVIPTAQICDGRIVRGGLRREVIKDEKLRITRYKEKRERRKMMTGKQQQIKTPLKHEKEEGITRKEECG